MDGAKLREYVDAQQYTKAAMLDMTGFSGPKLYSLFKQAVINNKDREALIKAFGLPEKFFESSNTEQIKVPADYEQLKIDVAVLTEKTAQLENRLTDKDRLIAILERNQKK